MTLRFSAALLVLLSVGTGTAFANAVWVKSLKADILAEPRFGSNIIASATRGEELSELTRKDRWVQVQGTAGKGWISSMLVGNTPPMEKISVLAETTVNTEDNARRRASSFTSAAAARGLTERQRASSGYTLDFASIGYMKQFTPTPSELEQFSREE